MVDSGVLRLIAALVIGATTPLGGLAQPVLLQLRPRTGDTLHLRLEQRIEMAGTVRVGEAASSTSESSTLTVLTRLAVESLDSTTTTLVAIMDSVRISSPPNSATATMLAWAMALRGNRFKFRIGADGSAALAGTEGPRGPSLQAGAFLAQMPGTLPAGPIAPGATWTNAMEVPLTSTFDPRGAATLRATFRFDSLTRSGQHAFISINGRLTRPAAGAKSDAGSVVETTGSVTGYVVVDRRRGWITDARTTVVVYSLVVPSGSGKPPMRVRMVISNSVRVM
jgi:hypothetical protein